MGVLTYDGTLIITLSLSLSLSLSVCCCLFYVSFSACGQIISSSVRLIITEWVPFGKKAPHSINCMLSICNFTNFAFRGQYFGPGS